jgi:hypothetical protein
MTWLLYLYPPRWRRRYGKEFVALIAPQRFSFFTVLDIIGGAIDAWFQPQSHLAPRAAPQPEGETSMLAKMMRLRCAGHGETPTTADSVKGAAVTIGGTILAVVVATWLQRRSIAPVFAETLMTGGWLIAFVASMPYTALKGWPARTQAVFMAVLMTVVGTLMFGGIWINRG